MQIYELTKQYNLLAADKSALDGLLYATIEGRISKNDDTRIRVRTLLVNACCCRAVSMNDMEGRISVIIKHAEEFLRNNRRAINASSHAGVGHRGKQKDKVHKSLFE